MRNTTSETPYEEATRERLLRAALDLLIEYGYRGATSRKIAKAAGVNEVTLFRHFASKDELLAAAVIDITETKRLHLPEPTGDLKADLLSLAQRLTQSMTLDSTIIMRLVPEISRLPEMQQTVVRRAMYTIFETLQAFFQYYQERGVLNREIGDVLPTIFFGPLFAHHYFAEIRGDTATIDLHIYTKLFLDGYRLG